MCIVGVSVVQVSMGQVVLGWEYMLVLGRSLGWYWAAYYTGIRLGWCVNS